MSVTNYDTMRSIDTARILVHESLGSQVVVNIHGSVIKHIDPHVCELTAHDAQL